MGVYIKNMSLMAFKTIMELGLKVDDDLLIEVKTPHGRFIDVGELEEDDAWDDYEDGFTAYSRLQISTQPTIIEAED